MWLLIRLIIELAWSLAMLALQIVLIMSAITLVWLGGSYLFVETKIGWYVLLGSILIVILLKAASSKAQ